MKVLVIGHAYIAKVNRKKWIVLSKIYKDLQLKIVFPNKWSDILFELYSQDADKESLANCSFVSLPAFKTGNEVLYSFYPLQIIKILRTFKPDLIHVEQGDNAFSYFQAILFSKIFSPRSKFLFFSWINWIPNVGLKYKLIWSLIEKFNLFASSGAIVGNNCAKKILEEKGFFKPIKVLPQLGVDQGFFVPALQAYNQNLVGYIGRIEHEKGVFNLVDAFEKIIYLFPEWKLVFVGDGSAKNYLKKYVSKKKLEKNVEFKSSVNHENVVNLLQLLDIFVLPSYDTEVWKEQFGHVLIEAMSCKVPVIGSTGGEIPNVIADAGFVFEQKNVEQLSFCLKKLMQDANLRKEFGQKGFDRVKKNFSHKVIAKETYEFWQDII